MTQKAKGVISQVEEKDGNISAYATLPDTVKLQRYVKEY